MRKRRFNLLISGWNCLDADVAYDGHEGDQMIALDTLAAYYVQLSRQEKNKEAKKEHLTQVE